ncbi:hypothetical protein [Janthinobacterium sp.]|uniref:hypothetical protein n=1 Tax=Janthinobacterium sp. TaxID=1871054 RepID=UPI00293D2912|nr:hypothetical protein [Janthinobacterium sp.]
MLKAILVAILCLHAGGAGAQSGLSEQERRWLRAGAEVLDYARAAKLPLDIIVQPQAAPGAVPLALGFSAGRCKLVLTLRGNPQAEDILAPLPPAGRALMIEAMTAHELGHCWRYVHGDWHALPAGFVEAGAAPAAGRALSDDARTQRDTRREEAYADLLALAWVRLRHPAQYAQVYDWLGRVRGAGPLAGASHDTRAWLSLVKDGIGFGPGATPFDQAGALWRRGLIWDK